MVGAGPGRGGKRDREVGSVDEFMDRTVRVPDQVLVQHLPDGESVILDMSTEQYFGLNAVGAAMWAAVTEGPTIGDAVTRLLSEYDVDQGELVRDVEELLDRLVERGLLEIADS